MATLTVEVLSKLKFNEAGLIAVVTQDQVTRQVLMQAWMNEKALALTLETGKATYFSRSRNQLWLKGETSGNFQEVISATLDCDGDTILLMVKPLGPACHTGEVTCFNDELLP